MSFSTLETFPIMPHRNLVVIILACIASLACYKKTQRNRYASLFSEAMEQVMIRYVDPVEPRTLFEGAMSGMLRRLDTYSAYVGPAEYREFQESLELEFGGIGIEVEVNSETERLTVLSPVFDTPAYKAGLLAGDTILNVNGQSTEGFSVQDAVRLLRGAVGSQVTLTIQHPGDEESTDVTLSRSRIKVPSVLGDARLPDSRWSFVLEEDSRIGYIRLTTFGEHTIEELRNSLKTLEDANVQALILDLRNNAGGLLDVAVSTCDMFLREGVIVTTRGRGGSVRETQEASRNNLFGEAEIPMAVIVNKYSASASEITAACLQDHDRAIVIGERTWGKGTVQNVIELEMGRSILKLTTATYWRPSGRNIHRSADLSEDDDWGVIPDEGFLVKLGEKELEQVLKQRRDRDYQVESGNESDPDNPASKAAPVSQNSGRSEPSSIQLAEGLPSDQDHEEPVIDRQLQSAINYLQGCLEGN